LLLTATQNTGLIKRYALFEFLHDLDVVATKVVTRCAIRNLELNVQLFLRDLDALRRSEEPAARLGRVVALSAESDKQAELWLAEHHLLASRQAVRARPFVAGTARVGGA
jgi:hypothetical protein